MFLISLAVLIVLGTFLYGRIKYHFSYWRRKQVPHEKPKLIIGNMRGVGRTVHSSELICRVYDKFKGQAPIAGMYFFFRKVALVLDLDLAKAILTKDFKNFHDRGFYANVKDDPLTGNLVLLEGPQWKAMRQKLTPAFTGAKTRSMIPAIKQLAENLVAAYAEMSSKSPELYVDVTELNARYTTDVIGTCAFGLECNSLKDPDAEFRKKGKAFLENSRISILKRTFMSHKPSWAKRFHMKTYPEDITNFFLDCVKQTIDYRVKNDVKRNDFMDIMISLMARKDPLEMSERADEIDLKHGLTMEQIAAQAFAFFIAGFSSSYLTISYCLYELVMNPDIQERLREEILEYLEKHNNELSYEAIQEMPYMDLVIWETLRLYPVASNVIRRTSNDYKIPDSNYVIEKGVTVIIPTVATQRDGDIFPEPNKFIPERFTKENKADRHPYSYLPFGEGPRNCIGIPIAQMQIKIALISLLRNFKFSRSSSTKDTIELLKSSNSLMPKDPILLKVERIQ